MKTWQNEDAISEAVKKGLAAIAQQSPEKAQKFFEEAYQEIYLHFREIDQYSVSRLYPNVDCAHRTAVDIFLGVWRGLRKFQFRSTWRTWVYAIAKRRIASALKKVIQERERFEEEDKTGLQRRERTRENKPTLEPTLEALLRQKEQSYLLQRALSQLETKERAILLMSYTYKIEMPEIMHIWGMSQATAYRRRAAALQKCIDFIKHIEKGNIE